MICSKCGRQIADNSKFCVYCGTKIEKTGQPLVCAGCGTPLKPGAKFCTKCGRKVEEPVQQTAEPAEQPQAPVQKPAEPIAQSVPPVQKPVPPVTNDASGQPAVTKSKAPLIIAIVLAAILLIQGAVFLIIGIFGSDRLETVVKPSTVENTADEAILQTSGKGDVALFDTVDAIMEDAKAEYEAGNYEAGCAHAKEALEQYMTIAEENNLQDEAQKKMEDAYKIYRDSVIGQCDNLEGQQASSAMFEQTWGILSNAVAFTDQIAEQGYALDNSDLVTCQEECVTVFKAKFIEAINNITNYENWSRDEAWNYAEEAEKINESGNAVMFDPEELDDPLRLRYEYSLAWVTRKRSETGLADGSLTKADVVNNMRAILRETDYNLLLLQDIISYGNDVGLDVSRYAQAYNAIVDEIYREQGLTIVAGDSQGAPQTVDVRHFWYFNDLTGEDAYKIDFSNGTTATTRAWIRNNVPGIVGE